MYAYHTLQAGDEEAVAPREGAGGRYCKVHFLGVLMTDLFSLQAPSHDSLPPSATQPNNDYTTQSTYALRLRKACGKWVCIV